MDAQKRRDIKKFVWERDGWVCQVCQKKIDPDRVITRDGRQHPMGPAVMRKFPKMLGHSPFHADNLVSAHYRCAALQVNTLGDTKLYMAPEISFLEFITNEGYSVDGLPRAEDYRRAAVDHDKEAIKKLELKKQLVQEWREKVPNVPSLSQENQNVRY